MVGVNDNQNQAGKVRNIILPLFRVVFKDILHEQQEWLHKPHQVDESKKLQPIQIKILVVDKTWQSRDHVEDKFATETKKLDKNNRYDTY